MSETTNICEGCAWNAGKEKGQNYCTVKHASIYGLFDCEDRVSKKQMEERMFANRLADAIGRGEFMVGDREAFGLPKDDMSCAVLPRIKGKSWCRKKVGYTDKETCSGCVDRVRPADTESRKMCVDEIL